MFYKQFIIYVLWISNRISTYVIGVINALLCIIESAMTRLGCNCVDTMFVLTLYVLNISKEI